MLSTHRFHAEFICILLGFVFLLLPPQAIAQQSETTKINGYYNFWPLDEVLDDLGTKHNLNFEFDREKLHKINFSYLFTDTPLSRALSIIVRDKPLTFFIQDDGTIVVNAVQNGIPTTEKVTSVRYNGAAEQTDITISGIVKDAVTGETLPFAAVGLRSTGNGVTSNQDGYFTLFHVPTDTSSLIISYIGYQPTQLFLSPERAKEPVTILLQPTLQNLEAVEIVHEKEKLMSISNGVSRISMSPAQMKALPSLGERDVFRSLQLLPGVSGSNEGSSGLYVRGGTPDQNLILYDGFTVYHVDHLFGMFSAFNANALKDVQLYKGGFESKFGGRLSSVVDMTGKSGNENNFNLGGDISLMSFNLFAEGPIGKKATFLLAGRKSYRGPLYNSFFDNFWSEPEPGGQADAPAGGPGGQGGRGGDRERETTGPTSFFYDLNAKFTYRPTDKDILTYSFFNGQDDLDNSRTFTRGNGASTGGVTDQTIWGNWGSSARWSRKWSSRFYSTALLSYSNYYSLRERLSTRTAETNGETETFQRGTVEDNDLRDFSLKLDQELKLTEANQIEFGLHATHFDIDYSYTQNDTITIQDRQDVGNLYSFYLQDRIRLGNLTLLPGLRSSYYSLNNKTYLEPRFSSTYQLSERLRLKGAWGHYHQFANRVIREDLQTGSRDFWILADDTDVPVSFSEHYIAGVSYEMDDWLFDVEGYYKRLQGLSEYTLRFVPQFREIDFNDFFYEGDGTARGIEFLLQRKFGAYTGWAGYTLGEVLYDFPVYGEEAYHANHDVTHEFKLVNSYRWKKWTFSGTWIYATGKPYTEPLGGYQVTLADGSTEDFIVFDTKNGSRYPSYHRLDLSATWDYKLGKLGLGNIGLSIFNAYNRQNVWYKEFEIEDGDLIETDVVLLGFSPNLTLSFKLR